MRNASGVCNVPKGLEILYGVSKYAGAWVPKVSVNGVLTTCAHCSTSSGAMEIAMREAKRQAKGEEA